MPNREEFEKKKPAFTALLNGYFGDGKTHNALSFPKVYAVCCDPSGLDILYKKGNEGLLKNLVYYEYLRNSNEEDLRAIFKETQNPNDKGSIYGILAHVKELATKKEIGSLLLDGFTYFVDMKWHHICEYEEQKSSNTGNVDTQAMYRNLGLYLQRFVGSDLLTLATRYGLNVLLTCHLKRESKEFVEGSDKTKNRARKVALESDLSPMIEGGYRNKIEGVVGTSIYLEKKIDQNGKFKYMAYCDKTFAYGTVVLAKNRYGLPSKLDITDKSLYDTLMSSINTASTSEAITKKEE